MLRALLGMKGLICGYNQSRIVRHELNTDHTHTAISSRYCPLFSSSLAYLNVLFIEKGMTCYNRSGRSAKSESRARRGD